MKTQVEFRSSKFPPYDGEEEEINPGLWGKRLAEYLVHKLAEKGIKSEEMVAEDWGWYVPIKDLMRRLNSRSSLMRFAKSSRLIRRFEM
jgi:hypothetical protein